MLATLLAAMLAAPVMAGGVGEEPAQFGYDAFRDSQGHGEDYWVEGMGAARTRVTDLEQEVDRLDTAIGALLMQWTSIDDPDQEQMVKAAWDDALERAERARQALVDARQAVRDGEEEARRAGALPGWLRGARAGERKAAPVEEQQTAVTYRVDLDALAKANAKADEDLFGAVAVEESKGQARERGE